MIVRGSESEFRESNSNSLNAVDVENLTEPNQQKRKSTRMMM